MNASALRLRFSQSLAKPSASVEPRDGTFNDPSFGQHDEGVQFIALDDFDDPAFRSQRLPSRRAVPDSPHRQRSQNERKQGTRAFVEDERDTVAILDAGGMNDSAQQQTERIYEKVALLALDLLSRIVAMRIDVRPPFSALFTLWLSMIAALGLASRSSRSLHST